VLTARRSWARRHSPVSRSRSASTRHAVVRARRRRRRPTRAAGATSLSVTRFPFRCRSARRRPTANRSLRFVTRWPNRGCILGGPIRGGFLDQPDRGGWEMTVQKSHDTFLRFNAGYAPPTSSARRMRARRWAPANARPHRCSKTRSSSAVGQATFETVARARWADLVVEIVGVGFFHPTDDSCSMTSNPKRIAPNDLRQLCKAITRARALRRRHDRHAERRHEGPRARASPRTPRRAARSSTLRIPSTGSRSSGARRG
jgi:hypothetical protein